MLQSGAVLRRVGVLAALCAGGITAACGGGGNSSEGPSALPERGAVIRGTVEGLATADEAGGATLHTASVSRGLKVSVVGTSIATSTDGSGGFVLTGVPAGRVELRFEGTGVDARVEIAGLSEGQEVRITVRVAGDDAVLVGAGASSGPNSGPSAPGDDDDDELTGKLEAINGTTLTVAGRTVMTDAATLVRRRGEVIPFSSLEIGQIVEVEGTPQGDGSILAEKVTIEDDDGEVGDDHGANEDHDDGDDEDHDDGDGDDPDDGDAGEDNDD